MMMGPMTKALLLEAGHLPPHLSSLSSDGTIWPVPTSRPGGGGLDVSVAPPLLTIYQEIFAFANTFCNRRWRCRLRAVGFQKTFQIGLLAIRQRPFGPPPKPKAGSKIVGRFRENI